MNNADGFETLFELPQQGWLLGPLLAAGAVVLPLALGALLWQRRRGRTLVLPGFFVVVGLLLPVLAGLGWWEQRLLLADLQDGRARIAEGVVQSHAVTPRAVWNTSSKRYDRSTWEAFFVGDTAFGFTRDGSAAGFTNGSATPLVLADGDVLRVHYVEATPGDFASRRILRLARQRMKHDRAALQRD